MKRVAARITDSLAVIRWFYLNWCCTALVCIRSQRKTKSDAEVNGAYRWFLVYSMSQKLPNFATISYAFRHRFTGEVVEGVFRWLLEEVTRAGYLSAEVVFVDGTHIKANVDLKKQVEKTIPVAAKWYQEQLHEEIEAIAQCTERNR